MNDNKSSFDSALYDRGITAVLLYYSDFHNQVIDLIFTMYKDNFKWLDTGCGTGRLVDKAAEHFKAVDFTLCDPSPNMLKIAKNKLLGLCNINFRNISSQQFDYKNTFDVVTAIQAHHYLNASERICATQKCYSALRENGVYITFENIAMSDKISDNISIKRWIKYMAIHGKSTDEIEEHISRRGNEVFPITIEEHLSLLRKCGFKTADILWTSYMQAGFFAVK